MKRRDIIIQEIKKTPITFSPEIELDNLDHAELVQGDNGVEVENEHGTVFPLEDLSDSELETFAVLLGIKMTFDYLIVDEKNNWLSYGTQSTQENINKELRDLKNEAGKDTKLFAYVAKELIKIEL